MKNLCIIADDLTGSTDTGVQFSKCGHRTFVVFDHKFLKDINRNYQIISINSESRNMNDKDAYERVKEITRITKNEGYNSFYKKIDSTMRGHPGIEIEAMLDELNLNLAFIVPSFPDNGRIVENGYLYLKKENSSSYGNQLQAIGYVPELIKSEISRSLGSISIDDVKKGSANIRQKVCELKGAGIQIFVVDAITNNDLEVIADAIKVYAENSIISGSAGLAEYISTRWNFTSDNKEEFNNKTLLFLVGTYNPVTAEQIKELLLKTPSNLIKLNANKIINGNTKKEIERATEIALESMILKNATIIAIDTLFKNEKESYILQMDIAGAEKIARSFGVIAKELTANGLVGSLIVTGGETAAYIFESLGAQGMILENEILPGIPNGKLVGGDSEGFQVVTKAGGFGNKDSFVDIVKFLNGKVGV